MPPLIVHQLVRQLLLPPPVKVLNLGCEREYSFLDGYIVTHADIDPESEKYVFGDQDGKGSFVVMDFNKQWCFNDESFDIVVGIEVIEHCENPWHFFREARRVTTQDGTLIITTPNILSHLDKQLFYESGRFRWFTKERVTGSPWHINPIPRWELVEAVAPCTGWKLKDELFSPPNDDEFWVSVWQKIQDWVYPKDIWAWSKNGEIK